MHRPQALPISICQSCCLWRLPPVRHWSSSKLWQCYNSSHNETKSFSSGQQAHTTRSVPSPTAALACDIAVEIVIGRDCIKLSECFCVNHTWSYQALWCAGSICACSPLDAAAWCIQSSPQALRIDHAIYLGLQNIPQ